MRQGWRSRIRACWNAPSCWRRWPRSRRTSSPAGRTLADWLAELDTAGIERLGSGRDWWRGLASAQPEKPPSSRKACSSGVVSRPSMRLRCGKRPKRSMMSRCSIAYFRYSLAVRRDRVRPTDAGRQDPRNARRAGRKKTLQFLVDAPVVARASALPGEMTAPADRSRTYAPVPRKQLRGNWSSRIISASALSGWSIQCVEFAPRGREMQVAEAVVKAGVERGVLAEPGVIAGVRQNFTTSAARGSISAMSTPSADSGGAAV